MSALGSALGAAMLSKGRTAAAIRAEVQLCEERERTAAVERAAQAGGGAAAAPGEEDDEARQRRLLAQAFSTGGGAGGRRGSPPSVTRTGIRYTEIEEEMSHAMHKRFSCLRRKFHPMDSARLQVGRVSCAAVCFPRACLPSSWLTS